MFAQFAVRSLCMAHFAWPIGRFVRILNLKLKACGELALNAPIAKYSSNNVNGIDNGHLVQPMVIAEQPRVRCTTYLLVEETCFVRSPLACVVSIPVQLFRTAALVVLA